jgi:predicted methyltransferase
MVKYEFGCVVLLAVACALPVFAAEPLPANIAAAAVDPARADQAAQDSLRHGPEILAFAGVSPGAKVVDLIPGGGYWTTLFAKAVGPSGHVYGLWPSEYVKVDGDEVVPYGKLVASPGYANVSVKEQPAAKLATPEKVDLQAGFTFAGESRMLANPADDHSKKVFDPSIKGKTDQFIYKFRKPE